MNRSAGRGQELAELLRSQTSAEAEFVDRVFVPVNYKTPSAEISAELDDVYSDLAHRVAGRRWRDLRASDDHRPGEQ